MTSPKWTYGAIRHWHKPNLSMHERVDRTNGKIGAHIYINVKDWKEKLTVNIPCVFASFDDLTPIGQAFADAALDLYGESK